MRIIDLSVPIDASTTSPPSQARKVEIGHEYRKPGWWQASTLMLSVHTGTHMDSPLHVIKGSPTIGEIGLDRVIGNAVILDLTDKGPNSSIGPKDLAKYDEKEFSGDIVALRTDWTDKKWGTEEYWNQSPYLTLDGAKWLVEKKPKAIAFDFFEEYSARLDSFEPKDFVVHREILGAGIIIVEHVINLGALAKERVKLFAIPLKIVATEASPARVFALEE